MINKNRVISIFNAITIGIAIISIWRGVWWGLDYYFIPNYPILSNIIPFVLGIIYLFFKRKLVNGF